MDEKSCVTFLLCDPGWYVHLMSRMNGKKTHTHTVSLIPPREDQCEWHRMTRMTGPDCVVMCNLINTHTHTHCAVFYCPIKYVPQPKEGLDAFRFFFKNKILPFILLSLISIKSFLSLTHAVTNARYSVNYKHHKRYW